MYKSKENTFLQVKEEIIEKYNKGYTSKELALEYNISRQIIVKYLKKYGVETRKKGKPTKRQIKKIKQAFIEKYGVENISQLPQVKEIVSKKRIDYLKGTNQWVGENNPNYGNRIGKNNGYHFGKRDDLGNIFWRSSWEANIARILNNNNIKWEYEPKRFGLSSKETYTPDFYLPEYNKYIEVKGWWRDDAKIKYNMFLEEYNEVKIKLIDSKFYYWLLNRNRNKFYLEGIKS
jgi:hypothetical protein